MAETDDDRDDGKTGNPYDLRCISVTADRMLDYYATPVTASDMAHSYAMDYATGTAGREYWQAVDVVIRRRGRARAIGRTP